MNIKEALIRDKSKVCAVRIANWIGQDQQRMDQLMNLFLSDEYGITQRAAYPLIFITDSNPALFKPYFAEMIDNLDKKVHDSVIRNTLRLFQHMDMPEHLEGKLYEQCFNFFKSPKYPVAIRVFAMTILANICIKYPELKIEIIPIIKDIMEITESAGMISRGKRVLKLLEN